MGRDGPGASVDEDLGRWAVGRDGHGASVDEDLGRWAVGRHGPGASVDEDLGPCRGCAWDCARDCAHALTRTLGRPLSRALGRAGSVADKFVGCVASLQARARARPSRAAAAPTLASVCGAVASTCATAVPGFTFAMYKPISPSLPAPRHGPGDVSCFHVFMFLRSHTASYAPGLPP